MGGGRPKGGKGSASKSKGKGKGKDKGKDKGKGGGSGGKGKKEYPEKQKGGNGEGAATKEAKETAEVSTGAEEESGSSSTRALVEALRAFSTPQWWLIGKTNAEDGEATRRRRAKPEEFKKMCSERHAEMRKVYESAMSQDSEQRWLRKVSSEGTAGDKVASLQMLIQVCPVFATGYLKALLTMASKTARSDSMMALDALKDLFVGTLLPDRKIRTLQQMEPISPKGLKKATFTEICVVAFFEDYLKTAFAAFVQVLGEAGHSSVVFVKTKAIRTAEELLRAKPEQERALLALLVNKFGDSSSKVSSNVSHSLKELLKAHPGMKAPVVKEVNAFLLRPNITQRSQYYAVLLLSELVLNRNEGALAAELVRLFVARLEAALRKPSLSKKAAMRLKKERWRTGQKQQHRGLSEEDNRLVRTLINGIRRAMPYLDAAGGAPLQDETVDALFKVCHTVTSFSTRISILSLLYRGLSVGDPPDRFYRLLYEQVAQFDLFSSTHRWQAFLLLKGCIPSDISVARGVAMGRRLLQVGANLEPAVAVAALGVLKDLFMARRPEVKPLLHSAEPALEIPLDVEGADAEEEHFVDDDVAGTAGQANETEEVKRYDALAREPRFARARHTPLWELQALTCHIHPFVAQGASKLVKSEPFEDAAGNPFDVFSVGELLEQFSYASKAHKDRTGAEKEKKKSKVTFNPERFAQRKNVPPHERFFQLYFKDDIVKNQQREKRLRRRQKEEDFDEQDAKEDDGGDEEEEDTFFDEYLKGEVPDENMGDDDEDGEDFDDPDLDDDDDADFGEGPDSDNENEGGEGSEGEDFDVALGPGGTKRKASDEDLSGRDRIKAIKKKHASSGSMFASIDDFQQLLDEDDVEYG